MGQHINRTEFLHRLFHEIRLVAIYGMLMFGFLFTTTYAFKPGTETAIRGKLANDNPFQPEPRMMRKLVIGDLRDSVEQPVDPKSSFKVSSTSPADDIVTRLNERLKDSEFHVMKTDFDNLGNKFVKLIQTIKGIPVIGSEIIILVSTDGKASIITGNILTQTNIKLKPAINGAQSKRIIGKEIPSVASVNSADSQLVIFNGRLAYKIEINAPDDSQPARWRCFVDAQTGELLIAMNVIAYSAPGASGTHQTVQGSKTTGEGGAVVTMQGWNDNGGNYFLYHKTYLWGVYNLRTSDWEQRSTNDWGTSGRAEISAAKNFDMTQNYVRTVLSMNSFDNAGGFTRANVHQGTNYVNAYWDGTDFHFGDGDGVQAGPLVCLDVVAHEYGHGITQHCSDLVYADESGALNESYSDIFGTLVEFASQEDGRSSYPSCIVGNADWLLGEDCWLADVALRDIRNPRRFGQPGYYKGTYWATGDDDNGGVHTNSGVQNFAFYLLSEGGTGTNDGHSYSITGLGIDAAGKIALYANIHLMTSTSGYIESRNAWIQAAQILGYNTQTVADVWTAVGVIPPEKHLAISPTSLDFGLTATGSQKTMSITLSNNGGDSTTVSTIAFNNTRFTTTKATPFKVGPATSVVVPIVFSPTANGAQAAAVTITSNAIDNPSIAVALSGTGTAPAQITVSPTFFHQTLSAGDSISRTMTITNPGVATLDFSITETAVITNSFDWLTFTPASGSVNGGNNSVISLKISARSSVAGRFISNLNITHNATGTVSPFTVACTLDVVGIKRLSASTSTINFNNIKISDSSKTTLTLTNNGSDTTTMSAITVTNNVFHCTMPVSLKVPPSSSINFPVSFFPDSVKIETGTLQITSNAADNPSISIILNGKGIIGPSIALSPNHIHLSTNAGDSAIAPVRISNSGDDTLIGTLQVTESILTSATVSATPIWQGEQSWNTERTPETGLVPAALPANKTLNQSAIVAFPFFDGFESGSYTTNWTSGSGAYTRTVTNTAPATGTYCFTQTGGNSTAFNGVSTDFSTGQRPTNISFSVRAASTSTSGSYVVLCGGGTLQTQIIWFYMNNAGRLYVNDNTTVPYQTNTWYSVLLKLNWNTYSFDYYVNGQLISQNIAFRNQTSITTAYLFNISNTQGWWDDINLGNIQGQWLSATPASFKVAPGAYTDLSVKMNARTLVAGNYFGNVVIQHNAAGASNPAVVPCTLSVAGIKRLSVSTSLQEFGSVWIGDDSIKTVQLTNNGNDTTTVSSLTINNAVFTCLPSAPIKVPPFSSSILSLTFRPTTVQTESGTMVIVSNAADNPSLSVTLHGTGITGPKIVVTPQSIARSTAINDSVIVPLLINNTGGDTLRFTAATIMNSFAIIAAASQTTNDVVSLSAVENEKLYLRGGPDTFGYQWIDSDDPTGPGYRWIDISSTGQLLAIASGCDDCFDSANLSFAFSLYGNSFSKVYVSSNGYLTFGSGSTQYSNSTLPSTTMPANLIAPLFDDLDTYEGGEIYFKDFNDSAIIQYNNVASHTGTGTYTFQVVLKKNGDIYYYYNSLTGVVNSATTGIQNTSRTVGFAIVNNATYLKNNLAIKITKQSPWLSVLPTSGKVPPLGSMTLNVTLNSRNVGQGSYIGSIALSHNDQTTVSPFMVPCTLTVINSTPPTVSFEASSQTVQENAGTVTVRAVLSWPSTSDVSVPFTVSGDASNQSDHNLTNGTIIIRAGSVKDSIRFQIVNDIVHENNETAVLTMGIATNAVVGAPSVHTVTITDNDPVPTVQFTLAAQNVMEHAATAFISAQLSAVSALPVTVPFTVSGTATGGGVDYTSTASPITIAAGSMMGTISISLVDDTLREVDKTIVVTIGAPTNATVGAMNIHTATILDDDFNGFITVSGLDTTARLYLYASSGWLGVKKFNGYGMLILEPGKYQAAIVQKNKRTEYISLTSRRGVTDSIVVQMRSLVPTVFDTLKRVTDANGSDINIGSIGSAVMEDIDRDGNEDLVTLSRSGILSIYAGNTAGLQSPQTHTLALATGEEARCLRIIDNDGDNVLDYLVGLDTGEIVKFNGSTLTRSTMYTAQNGLVSVELCDFNADNNFDLLLGYNDGTVDYAASNGTGGFLPAVPVNSGATQLSVGIDASVMGMSIDGDSLPDLLVGNAGGAISWFKRKAGGTYATEDAVNGCGKAMSVPGGANLAFGFNGIKQLPKIIATDNNGYVYQSNARLAGDFNNDGTVEFLDYMMLVNAWNTSEGDLLYDRRVNVVLSSGSSQKIDFYDYMTFLPAWTLSINR